jgi:hypothetical protein
MRGPAVIVLALLAGGAVILVGGGVAVAGTLLAIAIMNVAIVGAIGTVGAVIGCTCPSRGAVGFIPRGAIAAISEPGPDLFT